ncbi:MAG: hypothetical protein ACYCXF_07440 [Thermoleophilia bacterium]
MIIRSGFRKRLAAYWPIISVALLFVMAAVYFLPFYRYQVNPDATSYISIARKYADLDLRHAVNGYWGPLLSWLLVPFIWLRIDPLLASRIIALACSIGLLHFFWLLLRSYAADRMMSWLALLGLAGILMTWSMGPVTPDVLFAFLLFTEIVALDKAMRWGSWRNSAILGLTAALLYFCKAFGLYLFLAQLAVIVVAYVIAGRGWGRVVRVAARSLCVALILISPFVVAISVKYHQSTISTSGAYNFGTLAPETEGVPVHPTTVSGPHAPPNATAVSAWEDPSFIPVDSWSIYGSTANFRYYLTLVYNNLIRSYEALVSFGLVVAAGFVALFVYFIIGFKKPDRLPFYVSLSAILVVVGYSPIYVEPRYLWPVLPLALLGAIFVYRDLLSGSRLILVLAGVIVLISLWTDFRNLEDQKHAGNEIFNGAQTLRPYLDTSSHVASDMFNGSLYACYFTRAQCYGLINADAPALADDFKKFQIDYLLVTPQTAAVLDARGFGLIKEHGADYLDRSLYHVGARPPAT